VCVDLADELCEGRLLLELFVNVEGGWLVNQRLVALVPILYGGRKEGRKVQQEMKGMLEHPSQRPCYVASAS